MNGISLRNIRPATAEQRQRNAEKIQEALDEFKQASKDITEICSAKGLAVPILVA